MKTLRRCFLALTLALALSAGAAAVETSAFDFTDWNQVDYQSQVSILTSLGVVGGYADNSFRPDDPITRAEIAKIVSFLREDAVPQYTTSSYTDTADTWAGDYIEYCAEQGILGGYNGQFRPKDYVTARELAKALLVVLGQDSSAYMGDGWSEAVDEDADALGIYNGYTLARDLYVTRQQACLMISNALQCPVQVEQQDGSRVYILDEMMEPLSLLQYRFEVIPVVGVVEANAQVDLRGGGSLDGNLLHIAGYTKDFEVSEEVANDMSLIGCNVTVYARFFEDYNRIYGVPQVVKDTGYSAGNLRPSELPVVMEYGNLQFGNDTTYYINYERVNRAAIDQLQPQDVLSIFDYEGDNIIDLVLVTRTASTESSTEDETTAALH